MRCEFRVKVCVLRVGIGAERSTFWEFLTSGFRCSFQGLDFVQLGCWPVIVCCCMALVIPHPLIVDSRNIVIPTI